MSETSEAALRIGLVGASGWLGRSIGPALLRGRLVEPGSLFCFNRSGRSEHYADWPKVRWAMRFGVPENDADVIILSVRPRDFRQTTFDCAGKLVLSLMAGVTIDELRQRTGARRVARAMPNAAVEICRSYSPWVASQDLTANDRQAVSAILNAVGASDEVESEADLRSTCPAVLARSRPTLAIEWYHEKPDGRIIDDLSEWGYTVDELENPIHTLLSSPAVYRPAQITGCQASLVRCP